MKVSWKRKFQGCFKGVSRVFQGSFKKTFKVFQKKFHVHGTHRSFPSRRRACYCCLERSPPLISEVNPASDPPNKMFI